MITFDAFIAKYNGKFLEVAGSANAVNQCVDLANAYIREVLGLPIIEWTNAVDFPSKAGDKYQYILNTPTGVPLKGDLVIWKPSPGHIAVFIEGNVNRFTSFDQNFPVGSPCHIQEHNYTNVIGWLRARPPFNWEQKYNEEHEKAENLYKDKVTLLDANKQVKQKLKEIDQLLKIE